ncbi:MAG: hypothetical protein WCG98_04650 [bacterium]
MAGGEFFLGRDSAYPIKNYEAFEADPMESLMSAFAKTDKNEKLSLQILISPVADRYSRNIRKQIEHIKEGKRGFGFFRFISSIFRAASAENKEPAANNEKERKLAFSQQEL